MREFFKPWRRKIGVVTLGLACVFAAGWVRSQNFWVIASGPFGSEMHCFDFNPVGYGWTIEKQMGPFPSTKAVTHGESINWRTIRVTPLQLKGLADEGPVYRGLFSWRWGGFIIGLRQTHANSPVRLTEWRIPHWSIVIPLTVLCACLLLSKPRQTPPKHTAEPTPMTGA